MHVLWRVGKPVVVVVFVGLLVGMRRAAGVGGKKRGWGRGVCVRVKVHVAAGTVGVRYDNDNDNNDDYTDFTVP